MQEKKLCVFVYGHVHECAGVYVHLYIQDRIEERELETFFSIITV